MAEQMEWLTMNPQMLSVVSSLGSQVGETYIANPNCIEILNDMRQKMAVEDRTLRTLRRAIGFSQVVKKDLLPLLISVKDDRKVIDTTIKVLADLTTPVECLLPVEVMSKSEAGRNAIIELNWLLISCKETFLDPRGTRRIIDHIRDILYKGEKMNENDCDTLNDCVILLRNVLHIPDGMMNIAEGVSGQNQIMWNLFAQNFDKALIEMITGPRRNDRRIAMAQLVVLLYKDQRVATLQKLLNLWMEASDLSESSEDNESNTSPPEEESFSSLVTSDPISDSSDNSDKKPEVKLTGKRKQSMKQSIKKQDETQGSWGMGSESDQKMDCSSSKMSDCGYGTQAENQESISTSSNEDESSNRKVLIIANVKLANTVWYKQKTKKCMTRNGIKIKRRCSKPVHQKPINMIKKSRYANGKVSLTTQEKEELKRKKLMRRFHSNIVNMKAFLHHTPNGDDVAQLLKEFTVDFLLKAYNTLVSEMRTQLLLDSTLDRTHFSWLIAYFLKFAVQLELDLHYIRGVLSYEIISFLTYEGANFCEQYELMKLQQECDISTHIRKIHLIVTAIRELLQAINSYNKIKHISDDDRVYLTNLQKDISESEDLRCLFVLLLRQFSPEIHSRQYLRDVIVTNHVLLTFIENSVVPDTKSILHNHIKQFVPVEMMKQYGYLLECFEENGHFVNDCVFTMMHHVAGDLEHVTALFQPLILKTFNSIWENEFEICDDWSDLIEYVIHKFINTPRTIPTSLKNYEPNCTIAAHRKEGWNQRECDCLYWYYVQSANSPDPVGGVVALYAAAGITNKSRIGVIEQLLKQDVITGCQYNELMKKEPISTTINLEKLKVEKQPRDEIELLKDYLMNEEKMGDKFITWLQKVLLETCYAKTFLDEKNKQAIEPIAHYSAMLKEAVPIIAWSCEQVGMLQSQVFLLLLHKLGFQLPADAGKAFPRIPSTWSSRTLFSKAVKLGPINQDWTKFKMFTLDYFNDDGEDVLSSTVVKSNDA
uniref:Timeless-d isoform E n=1 Tax=Pyrrhocoris apterus TaxID=37000 RepID=A0A8K1ZRJ9_PYRAP|nr:timeless-d isoform E [Pyrrhocoris apterus]